MNFNAAWVQGYSGSDIFYINPQTIAFLCGRHVKFHDVSSGEESVFTGTGEGISAFAASQANSVFAVSDISPQPNIRVVNYPDFEVVSILEDGANLDYHTLALSTGEALASLSTQPDFRLTIWNFVAGIQMCQMTLNPFHSFDDSAKISFSPINWRQLCLASKRDLLLWSVEQSDTKFLLVKQIVHVPATDGSDPLGAADRATTKGVRARSAFGVVPRRHEANFSENPLTSPDAELPDYAIAGVIGDLVPRFNSRLAPPLCRPVSHAWSAKGDLLVGCEEGQLLRVDVEGATASLIFRPVDADELVGAGRESSLSGGGAASAMSGAVIIREGGFQCMALHRDGLYVGGTDGILRIVDVSSPTEISILGSHIVGAAVNTLTFDAAYDHLALGSPQAVHVLDVVSQNLSSIADEGFGAFVGVEILAPSSSHVVTARETGLLQTWNRRNGQPAGVINVFASVLSLAASPTVPFVGCGLTSGRLCVVDLSKADQPRIVHEEKLHRGPVVSLAFDPKGQVLVTGSTDNVIYVINASPSKKFEILGYVTAVTGVVAELSLSLSPGLTTDNDKFRVVAGLRTDPTEGKACQRILVFEFPMSLAKAPSSFHAGASREFKDQDIQRSSHPLPGTTIGIAYTYLYHTINPHYIFTLRGTQLLKAEIPPLNPARKATVEVRLPIKIFAGHTVEGGGARMTPAHDFLVTFGSDGYVNLREVSGIESNGAVFTFRPHDFRRGAIINVCVTPDLRYVFTVGVDGVLTSYKWNSGCSPKTPNWTIDAAWQQQEAQALTRMRESPTPRPVSMPESGRSSDSAAVVEFPAEEEMTWIEKRIAEAVKEEDKLYAKQKQGLRNEIGEVKRQLGLMMKLNYSRPKFEQLGRDEFELDMDEKARIEAEAADRFQKIREDIRYENLGKMYKRDLIKQECWDSMTTKGRSLRAFNTTLVVANYPLRARSKEELDEIQFVINLRKIEKEEVELRKEFVVEEKEVVEDEEEEQEPVEEEEEDAVESPAIQGSLGAEFGGGSEYFYSQFDLHTRAQKVNQIILLQDAIYRIRETFNKEFNHVFAVKEQQILKIQEKNRRIKKILKDLDIADREVYEPELAPDEKPELLLTVADEEVKVEKYISPEMKAYIVEQARIKEEERLAKLGDNARERALEQMMGGVLEVKKEDELKRDIPPPAFVVGPEAKEEDDWNDDEKNQFKEYERKVKELNEEREKFRKQLETELKKGQASIIETVQQFDEQHTKIFLKKVKTEMVISQEEMKILRIRKMLLMDEELDIREKELVRQLEEKRTARGQATQAATEARKMQEAMRDQYDIFVAEDRVMEKSFRKDFPDCSAAMVEQLFKLYKKRPRGRGLGAAAQTGAGFDFVSGNETGNPYGDRPATAERRRLAAAAMESALQELDDVSNKPDNCNMDLWQRLCQTRRAKIDSEQQVKQKALVLAQMAAFTVKRQEEDERLKGQIEELITALSKLNDTRLKFTIDNQIQLLIKQGQVEIDMSVPIYDYSTSVLIHRGVVEELNGAIRALGESKILSMVESKDFRKGIVQLEWEQKKCQMRMEDLCDRARDIQMLKVTRDIQSYLATEDHEAKKAQEIQSLEESLSVQDRTARKEIKQKQKVLREKQKAIEGRMRENADLDAELETLNVAVNERRHVNEATAADSVEIERLKRMKALVQRRRLVDVAKSQAQEVALLRAEVERMRMRTFPALVQIEH